jgi:hypothetical protein
MGETMHHVAGVAVIGQLRPRDLKHRVRQLVEIQDTGIWLCAGRRRLGRINRAILQTSSAGREQVHILDLERWREPVKLSERKRARVEGRRRRDRIFL